nr:MAG TPA: hypothetical protein [Caudoviricetes sp.]
MIKPRKDKTFGVFVWARNPATLRLAGGTAKWKPQKSTDNRKTNR